MTIGSKVGWLFSLLGAILALYFRFFWLIHLCASLGYPEKLPLVLFLFSPAVGADLL